MSEPIEKLRELTSKWRTEFRTCEAAANARNNCAKELEALLPALEQREQLLRKWYEKGSVDWSELLAELRAALGPEGEKR